MLGFVSESALLFSEVNKLPYVTPQRALESMS